MKKRLEYIDRLKGLAMIMVVAGHIIAFAVLDIIISIWII